MDFEYFQYSSIPDNSIVEGIMSLHRSIFGDSNDLVYKMESKKNLLINVAIKDTHVVGYKIGYELNHDKFYSWLGGVDKDFRKYGVASKLMDIQHQYLKENGYKIVQTKTMNKWKNMLILNIKKGFDVISTYTDEKGEIKVILEKSLIN